MGRVGLGFSEPDPNLTGWAFNRSGFRSGRVGFSWQVLGFNPPYCTLTTLGTVHKRSSIKLCNIQSDDQD